MAVAWHLGVPQTGFELQMLYGMADPEKQVLVDLGYRMRIYMPYGELIPGMAYLVRRLLENTSNDSFLRASFTEHVAVEKIAHESAASCPWAQRTNDARESEPAPPAVPWPGEFAATFHNEPVADFARSREPPGHAGGAGSRPDAMGRQLSAVDRRLRGADRQRPCHRSTLRTSR